MKKMICIILAAVFLITGAYLPIKNVVGIMSENADSVNRINSETPVADFSSLPKELVDSEYAQVYGSEEEYNNAVKRQEEIVLNEASLNADEQFKPFWQTIEVLRQKDGKPVPDAVVIVDGVPRFANALGQVFLRMSKESVTLRVDADGFNPYVEYYDADVDKEVKTVNLKKPGDDIEIYGAILKYDTDTVNLVTQQYGIDRDNQYEQVYSDLTVETNKKIDKCYLGQGDKVLLTSDTGSFNNVEIENVLSVGKDAWVQVDVNGVKSEKQDIDLEIVDTSELNLQDLVLKDKRLTEQLKFDLGDSILGSVGLDAAMILMQLFPSKKRDEQRLINFEYIYDNKEKTLKIGLGVEFGGNNKKQRKEILDTYNTYKRSMRTSQSRWGKSWLQSFKTAMHNSGVTSSHKQPTNFSIKNISNPQGDRFNIDFDFCGFIELKCEGDNNYSFMDAGIGFDFSISIYFGTQIVVWIIPFYVGVNFGVSLGTEFKVTGDFELLVKLMFQFQAKVGAGIGLKFIAHVGVWGSGTFGAEMEFGTDSQFSSKGYFDAQGGVEARFLFFYKKWQFWDMDNKVLWDTKNTKLNQVDMRVMSANAQGYANMADNLLADDLNVDSRLQIAEVNGRTIATWLGYDSSRNEYNQSCLMYSVLENNIWSTPEKVYDDRTADFYPSLKVVNDKAYLAWTNMNTALDGETTIEEMSKGCEISVMEFDGKGFGNYKNITNDNKMNALPQISLAPNGEMAVCWIENSEDNILCDTGTNSINYSALLKGGYTSPERILETERYISSYDSVIVNGDLKVAASLYKTNDYSNLDETEIYLIDKSGYENITNDEAASVNPQFVMSDGKIQLYFADGGDVSYYDMNGVGAKSSIGFSGTQLGCVNFNVVSNGNNVNIVYLKADGNGDNQLYKAFYDSSDEEWIKNVKLSEGINVDQYAVVLKQNGTIQSIYSETLRNEGMDIVKAELYYADFISNDYDLEVSELYYYDNTYIGKGNLLYIGVKNNGSYWVQELSVNIDNTVLSYSLDEKLKPGESVVFNIPYNAVGDVVEADVRIAGAAESSYENNQKELCIRYSAFNLAVNIKSIDGKEIICCDVSNVSKYDSNITVIVKDSDGKKLYETQEIKSTKYGSQYVELSLDYKELNITGTQKLTLEIASDVPQVVNLQSGFVTNGYKEKAPVSDGILELLEVAKRVMM